MYYLLQENDLFSIWSLDAEPGWMDSHAVRVMVIGKDYKQRAFVARNYVTNCFIDKSMDKDQLIRKALLRNM